MGLDALLGHLLVKEYQKCKNLGLRLAVSISEIQHVQGRRKSEMHRMTPNWTWRLNNQMYAIYTKYLPLRPKFWSVSLND